MNERLEPGRGKSGANVRFWLSPAADGRLLTTDNGRRYSRYSV